MGVTESASSRAPADPILELLSKALDREPVDVVALALAEYEAPLAVHGPELKSLEDFLVVVDGQVRCRSSASKSIELDGEDGTRLVQAVLLSALWELAADAAPSTNEGPDEICQECLDPEGWIEELGSVTNLRAAASILCCLTITGPVLPWRIRESTVAELGKARADVIFKRMAGAGLLQLDGQGNVTRGGYVTLGPLHTRRQCILDWWFAARPEPDAISIEDCAVALQVEAGTLRAIGRRVLDMRERKLSEAQAIAK